MARATIEQQAATKFIQSVSTLDFRPGVFAVMMGMSSLAVQRRCLAVFMAFVDHLCEKFDGGFYKDEDELELFVEAKRMQDAMIHFR